MLARSALWAVLLSIAAAAMIYGAIQICLDNTEGMAGIACVLIGYFAGPLLIVSIVFGGLRVRGWQRDWLWVRFPKALLPLGGAYVAVIAILILALLIIG
ncbi:MAG: hypothetical protein AAGK00_19980 [Pseudomonadota bacterium]